MYILQICQLSNDVNRPLGQEVAPVYLWHNVIEHLPVIPASWSETDQRFGLLANPADDDHSNHTTMVIYIYIYIHMYGNDS